MTATASNKPALCFSAMAGRFPGADSIEGLWELLQSGRSASSQSLLPRWNLDADSIYHPRPGSKDRVYLHNAFALADDAHTGTLHQGRQLGIGQQVLDSLLAQCQGLDRQRTALIVATSWSDESYFIASAGDPAAAGLTPAQQIARLAAEAHLGGPALTVDTACSSFPYALDMAGALISSGQADQVVVMALNTLMPPALFLGFSQLTAFSPRARLQAFGQDADGIVPGECAVAFLLEPPDCAVNAGRQPLARLQAVGLSADGAEGSAFAPGERAQYTAYQRAWAGLDPASASYLESHGTGTPLGDATELGSLQRFFGAHRADDRPLTLGSIKTTIGHTLAAAGGPALAKALLMLAHRQVPPQVDYPASAKLDATCLRLATSAACPLPAVDEPLRIGISSFGFGGANAHVVVEEYRPQPAAPVPAPSAVVPLDLMVVEAEAAFAHAGSLHELAGQLHQPPAQPRAFPSGRFGDSLDGQPPLYGHFLSDNRVIDIHGYGMGPKPLNHIDPFKLLIADRVGHLLRRLPGVAGNSSTAMIMCCNMGGERFTNAYSAASGHYRDAGSAAPGIEVADVATMLPCMLSGYPAKIFDLRGFHQTLAGTAGLFWHTLLAAPQWFEQGIDTLLLGAGRFLSGAVEVRQAHQASVAQGEGMGVLALRRYRQDDEHTPLLRLHAALPGHAAPGLEQARQLLAVPAHTTVSQCQLQASPADPLQGTTGYLAEASGITTLLAVLLDAPGPRLIEVRQGDQVVLWLHAEQLRAWQAPAETAPLRSPFTLNFAPARVAPPISPRQTLQPAEGVDMLALGDTMAQTLLSSLQLRSRALQALLEHSRQPAAPLPMQRHPRHSVIQHVVRRSPQSLHAQLVVDESHPYFFDHPLDHVPGILLIEGALQLGEYAVPGLQGDGLFIHGLSIRFHRYVQKQRPVTIELQQQGDTQVFVARLVQDEQLVCLCTLSIARGDAQGGASQPNAVAPCTRQAWLHKVRAQNILVGDIDTQGQVLTTAIAAGHFFHEGHPHCHSMVYFLEIARQAFMQVAHGAMGIALNTPMNLLALDFSLRRPLPRGRTLTLATPAAPATTQRAFKTNRTVIQLLVDGEPLGQASLTAQVLSEQLEPA
ncbi:beta-ketoacyl synthase N-terminal-like domain-containing protein [Pseudomonas sp. TE3610]